MFKIECMQDMKLNISRMLSADLLPVDGDEMFGNYSIYSIFRFKGKESKAWSKEWLPQDADRQVVSEEVEGRDQFISISMAFQFYKSYFQWLV